MKPSWATILLLVAVFSLGWLAHRSYSDRLALAMTDAADNTRQALTELSRQSGEVVEKKLTELKANEIHTERIIRTEVIKPVFSTVCATDEYVRLFNQSADAAERSLSGESTHPLPGNPAPPGGDNRR